MDKESRLALNRKSGYTQLLTKKIWSNPFRMKHGNWVLIESPPEDLAPVTSNMPEFVEPPPYVIPEPIDPITPEAKPQPKNKKR